MYHETFQMTILDSWVHLPSFNPWKLIEIAPKSDALPLYKLIFVRICRVPWKFQRWQSQKKSCENKQVGVTAAKEHAGGRIPNQWNYALTSAPECQEVMCFYITADPPTTIGPIMRCNLNYVCRWWRRRRRRRRRPTERHSMWVRSLGEEAEEEAPSLIFRFGELI